jgi:hypothetical protein
MNGAGNCWRLTGAGALDAVSPPHHAASKTHSGRASRACKCRSEPLRQNLNFPRKIKLIWVIQPFAQKYSA